MRKFFLIWIALAALLTACHRDLVYSRFMPIPSEEWHMDSVAHFDYTIADTTVSYRTILYVRHTENYPYQNMWLFVGDSLHQDTIEFYLADDRGRWLGDQHHGFIEMTVLYEEECHFRDTGTYYLEVVHGMRDTVLRGVADIGVEICKISN